MAIFLINLKLYSETLGDNGRKLAEHAKRISDRLSLNIVLAPNFSDIRLLSGIIPVVAQHIDPVEPGAHTGSITAESVKTAGAIGTLINHSERKLSLEEISECIAHARKNGLMTVCCAESPEKAAELGWRGLRREA